MTQKGIRIGRIIYHVLITLALVTVAVLFIAACVGIYRTGEHPFTREVVAQHFARIALPVYLCLALVVLGFVLHPLLPEKPARARERDTATLRRLRARVDLAACPTALPADIAAVRRRHAIARWVGVGLLVAGVAGAIAWAAYPPHFRQSDITGFMRAAKARLIPALAIAFAYGLALFYLGRRWHRRELALLRQAPAAAGRPAPTPAAARTPARRAVQRATLLVAALGLLVGGLLAGGWLDVLTKAINICTECIGLG